MVDIGFAKDAAAELVPPGSRPKSPRARWEWAVVIVLGVYGMIGGWHIAAACGWLTFMGVDQFAMAGEVTQEQHTLDSIQLRQVEHDIRDAKTHICLAQKAQSQSALDSWSQQLEAARGQYFAMKNQWPMVLGCEDLLIAGNAAPAN